MSKYIDTENLPELEMALQTQRAVLRNTLDCVMAEIKCANERINLLEEIIKDAKDVDISYSLVSTKEG